MAQAQQMMSNLWENYAHNDSGTVNSTHKELLFDAIRKEGLRRESIFLVATLRRLAQGSINDLDGSLISNHSLPLDLTQDILKNFIRWIRLAQKIRRLNTNRKS